MGTATPTRPAEVPGPTEHERFIWTFEETPTNRPAPEKKRPRAGAVKFETWLKDNKAAIWNINKNKKVNYHFERFPNLRGARRGDQKGVRISYIGAAGTSRETTDAAHCTFKCTFRCRLFA